MNKKAIPQFAWFIPLAPIALASAIYFGELQSSSFLFINQLTQQLPNILWAWLTFLGNGWGVFALAFPLLLLAPRMLTAGIFAGVLAALTSPLLKGLFNLPRPAGVLIDGSFHRIGEALLHKAFPSGHTLTAFAIASALYFSANKEKRTPLLILFLLAALVGLSRNAVGAHWLTDVLGGAGFGMWCGMVGALMANQFPVNQLGPRKIWTHLIALGGVVAIYAHLTQIMDLELNLPLQYLSIAIVASTLAFYVRAQFAPAPHKAE
ncbi:MULTISPECIES: phosphatase PAP2 family protein [unclassified Polynucleobacter]|jgi:membrane-associated phospholipid phosphatase|uniref:phosphatase PAP2 family protein n=1 Tax=unclassified Polynucleobacter TaxID=2640945 RepID=UPI001C0E36BD|nr:MULTISPECIES: phosphatase PAP2 family protein [unclassified Polynucleobacter]MBU3603759.1 phosphatase PAP2 family protein [Polynucleobacter sp. AP-Kaivos-20-H2]MBU3619403.1 phosphatase PAP2 family protein [Polynucleobacter sp. JS-Fieb-80-E5]